MFQRNLQHATRINYLVNQSVNREAIIHFLEHHKNGFQITDFLLSKFTKACGHATAIDEGKQAHCLLLKLGFGSDTVLATSLLNMYSKCGKIQETCHVFEEMPMRDVITINNMISALFRSHLSSDGETMFDNMLKRDVASWNCIISGLTQNLECKKALFYFQRMRLEGFEPDVMTMVSILSACANIAALINGKQVHELVIKYGFEPYLPIGNAIIDMYAKCGYMGNAYKCFKTMAVKNVISWTSLIVGYGKHGQGAEAMNAFFEMENNGIVPNKITFLGILYACSHAGLVDKGWRIFNSMVDKYSITPTIEHYTCMVDILARSGRLQKAFDFIRKMPVKPDAKLWTALLSSCCAHKNTELAKVVGEKLLELKPEEPGAYMLLSNFYGLVGELENVAKVRKLMLNRGIRKEKAWTSIEINKNVHRFESGDTSHPLCKDIYSYLKNLVARLKEIGYVPNTSMVMQNVDEKSKEEIVFGHSEKLAIALALMSTRKGSRIVIVKNLRICVDCHNATALISKMEGREIIARDSSRFHHFKDGVCSCRGHW
ncbi:hypothetical protein ACFE04_011562 [Oxalis oulophora]